MRLNTKMIMGVIVQILLPFILILAAFALLGESLTLSQYALIFAALGLTGVLELFWIGRNMTAPVNMLNRAMQHIRDGDFEYRLVETKDMDATKNGGEIGELYRNYEDMRLRLKESAEEKLLHEKQNQELVSNISHDLKTPITAVKGYAEGLLEGVADTPEKREKYLRTIVNKADDINRLINELTLYSSIDSNRIPYHFQRLPLAAYFADCVEEIGMDLESRGIKLDFVNLTAPDTLIIADPEQLSRVIGNIVSNSVKYLGREDGTGQIEIRLLDEVDAVRIEIEDNGRGIAPKDLPNIFDRFYRTDASRSSKVGGSGIGLSIVKKIIEDHGGYIWATSKEKEGTTMHIVLRKYVEPETKEGDLS